MYVKSSKWVLSGPGDWRLILYKGYCSWRLYTLEHISLFKSLFLFAGQPLPLVTVLLCLFLPLKQIKFKFYIAFGHFSLNIAMMEWHLDAHYVLQSCLSLMVIVSNNALQYNVDTKASSRTSLRAFLHLLVIWKRLICNCLDVMHSVAGAGDIPSIAQ